ncbi:GNAT family N-acetyltransferase [Kitasatospora sp. GP82]|uniref:GNAT family N-acetyltransferase n=1 Tax=Kitasatospora sp. GP82 TaxID=3035089 RepID=UPI002476CFF4|nr:GNAT family N-acetyltransferase [Kitasatospora sp. GP82]MDH6128279.1 GNAT superfamily N-acetyltransferase [Kitasatospora sp. GP82]
MSGVVAQARKSLDDIGLTLAVKTDFSEFCGHLSGADGADGVNPAFDPRHSRLSPDSSFWISAQDHDGSIAGCIAYRTFRTHDVRDLIRTMKIFCEEPCAAHAGTLDLVLPAETPRISGLVGFPGGLWVSADYRGNGISEHMMNAVRREALKRYSLDWEVAITFKKITESASLRDIYDFQHVVPCIDGFFPPTRRVERIALQFSSRTHLLRSPAALDEPARTVEPAPPVAVR